MAPFDMLSGTIGFVVVIFITLLAILWFILPFAIFGTKRIMRQKLAVEEEMLEQLKAIDSCSIGGQLPTDRARRC